MAQVDRHERDSQPDNCPATLPYSASGHPSVEQLMAGQGTGPISDVSVLHGNFWPEKESVEEFVAAIREWRGHRRTEPSE